MTEKLPLSEKHREKLFVESAISEEVAAARPYRTVTDSKELEPLGFSHEQRRTPGLLIPIYAPDGSNGLYQFRPDNPRMKPDKKGDSKVIKYEFPAGAKMRIDCPKVCKPLLDDPKVPIWITEGASKGDSLASQGLCSLALLGVWNFKGTNAFGGKKVLADLDNVAWNGRDVHVVFDSDVVQKPEVGKALDRFSEILRSRGAHVTVVYLQPKKDGSKVGVDDFLRDHSVEELQALVTAPRMAPKPAAAIVELLDEAPDVLNRPLQIVGGRAYASTWLHIKTTRSETVGKDGKITRHVPPIETTDRQLFILRDDGALFGNGVEQEFADLGFDVRLSEPLQDRVCMAAAAIRQYKAKETPSVLELFNAIADVFDRFLDFDGSLANQRTMCEMAACFAIATWFLDAFNAAGYIYPTGGAGSGKTQFLSLMCLVAYLGEFVQASGSFASIRDLSNYGAFLGFDDAENVTSKNFDPDKRNILLSGTKRGSQIPMKEPDPSGRGWVTKYVNTFAFRGFSAIRSPDTTLGSRTITVPLIRTSNKAKGDSDPLEFDLWPMSPKEIRSRAWQVALKHLVEMQKYERTAKARAGITGRNLEAWIGVLAVAAFIDDNSESVGLFDRMNALAVSYQKERPELETADITRLLLRAVIFCIDPRANEPFDLNQIISSTGTREWSVTTAEITEKAHDLIKAEELDFDVEFTNSRRVGRAIGKLRIPKTSDGKKRGWDIQAANIEKHLKSYSLLNVSDVNNVSNVSESDVSDVSYSTYVSKPTGEEEKQPTVSEPLAALQDSPLENVSSVTNVNNVKHKVSCQVCMAFGYIGYACPNCGEVITDHLGETA